MSARARATCLLTGLVGSVLATGVAHASAPEPGTQRGGVIAQTGWWNSVNEPPPPNPLLPAPPPPAPDVPEGTLPVTAVTGEPSRISAIEFALDGEPGSTVTSVELSLRPSASRSGTVNADGAVILACAVTEPFWVGGENNPWKNRPEYDCEAGEAAGVRDAKTGSWSFDLTALAADWKSEDFVGSPSVVLVPAAEGETGEPLNFQVVFDGVEAKGIGLAARSTAPTGSTGAPLDATDATGDSGGPGTTATLAGGDAGSTRALGSGGSDSAGSLDGLDAGALAVDPPAASAPDAALPATGDPAAAAGETEDVANVSSAQPPWYQGFGKLGFLIVPLAVVLAYLAMLAMGPAAQPTGITNRRGVSRALDKLRITGAGIVSKVGR